MDRRAYRDIRDYAFVRDVRHAEMIIIRDERGRITSISYPEEEPEPLEERGTRLFDKIWRGHSHG